MNKKILISVFITALLIMALSGILIFAKESPENVAGIYTFVTENADSAKIENEVYTPTSFSDSKNKITLNISGCDSNKCSVYLNETQLGYLSKGICSFEFDSSLMTDDKNEIKIMLSSGSDTYTGGEKYGDYNLDDIVVESVSIQFGSLEPISPDSMVKYMPVVNDSEIKEVNASYSESQPVGDGWNNDTKLGGTTPNTPIFVGYIFNKLSDDLCYFSIDTTEFEDGEYKLNILNGGEVTDTRTLKIDNTYPELIVSFKNGDMISNSKTINFDVEDDLPVTFTAQVDGIAVKEKSVSLQSFSEGKHTLYLTASDDLGNNIERLYEFTVKQTIPDYDLYMKNGSAVLSISKDASAKVYSAELIGRINMYTNRLGDFSMNSLRSSDEVLASFSDKDNITTESVGNTLPYQSFVVDVTGKKGDAVISYTGETGSGDDILLQVWNYKNKAWDTLARTESGVSISFKADIATYSNDGKMRVKASPYVFSNGSDALLWVTDTQYYPRYEDLYHVYTDIMNYAKDEYIAGNIGYVVHTGDLVDQTQSGDAIAHKQYKIASDAQSILDKALVPNGVVSGNHDIYDKKSDYSYYYEYFGSSRYENFEWYGSSLNNNMHHYDLITIGSYDFLFLYIGCYEEANLDTLAWANAVLKAYPERNAVICTHEYLLPSGAYSGDRAQVIWDKIAVPNDNVKMILCGHNDGTAKQLHQVGDSDRYVLEILSDYQFAELGTEPSHVENGCTCDGEGFIRLMTFNDAGQVITVTYSPTADKYNYFPAYDDTFVYDIDLIPSVRSIKTTNFAVGVNIKEEGIFGKEEINLSDADGVFAVINEGDIEHTTEILTINNNTVPYPAFSDTNNYETEFERFEITGMRGVLPSLRHNEKNKMPSDKLVENGLDLMPSKDKKIYRTSGSDSFLPTYSEDRKCTLKFSKTGSNTWVTTALDINEKIDTTEFNRLYFGVTADENAKWNLCVNFSNGKTLNFSQGLYKHFGYEDYCIPSDIKGTWQGYIPLDEYISGSVTVNNVFFVAATPDTPITFDYFFLGKSLGEEVVFVTDENTAYSADYMKNQEVEELASPIKNGYTFDGWYNAKEGGELIQFPVKVKEDGFTAYAHFNKNDIGNNKETEYFNDEVEIFPGTNYKKIVITLIIILTIIAGIAAAIISAMRHKKKVRSQNNL